MINENTLAFFTFFFKKKKPNKQTNKYLLIMIFLLRDFKFYRLWFVFSGRYCFIMNVMVLVLYGPSSLSYKALFKLLHTFQVRMTFSVSNTSTLWVGNIAVAERWSQMEKISDQPWFICASIFSKPFLSTLTRICILENAYLIHVSVFIFCNGSKQP